MPFTSQSPAMRTLNAAGSWVARVRALRQCRSSRSVADVADAPSVSKMRVHTSRTASGTTAWARYAAAIASADAAATSASAGPAPWAPSSPSSSRRPTSRTISSAAACRPASCPMISRSCGSSLGSAAVPVLKVRRRFRSSCVPSVSAARPIPACSANRVASMSTGTGPSCRGTSSSSSAAASSSTTDPVAVRRWPNPSQSSLMPTRG